MRRLSSLLAASMITLTLGITAPVRAQWIVFDPDNYLQNVLTAAREIEQINNQITSLQNEAQMLTNQARNLANLPYSSLQQLQSSIQRTQQLLAQAQRIAYDVQQIDQPSRQAIGRHPATSPARRCSPTLNRAGKILWLACRTHSGCRQV